MRMDDAVFGRIKTLVIERTLHHYYNDKDDQLRDRLHRRLSATGLDPHDYLRLLETGASAEWASLESEVTINETFFFRFAEQFGSLHDTILPSLIEARAATRRLRIWSAGCSTGAEPYSVAILLHRLLGDALPDWSISILGTDIDEAALQTARAGDFNDWALRTLSPEQRRRDFIPLDGERGKRWRLRPMFRAMVRFEKHNLLDTLRVPAQQADGFDLVLCRNVLIYFHQDTVRALVRRFGAALAEDGWLLLGHAEAVGHTLDELTPVSLDGTVAWRRANASREPARSLPVPAHLPGQTANASVVDPRATRPARGSPAPTLALIRGSAQGPSQRPAQRPTQGPARATTPALATTPASMPASNSLAADASSGTAAVALAEAIDHVRGLADRGQPEAALLHCRAALERFPLSEALHFYSALLHRALDRDGDAETDFRRVLYLCKSFVMAHYHLGLLLFDAGRPEPARRFMAEARRIARTMPEDAPLPCGDGMTAGGLRVLGRQGWFQPRDGG